MATTSDGIPYPVGTDLVRDGDNVMAAMASAISRLGRWVASGRVDGQIEGNGYLRLGTSVSWPDGRPPSVVVGCGIDHRFPNFHWDGTLDGSGTLVRVTANDSSYYPPGTSVAVYFICTRQKGSAP